MFSLKALGLCICFGSQVTLERIRDMQHGTMGHLWDFHAPELA